MWQTLAMLLVVRVRCQWLTACVANSSQGENQRTASRRLAIRFVMRDSTDISNSYYRQTGVAGNYRIGMCLTPDKSDYRTCELLPTASPLFGGLRRKQPSVDVRFEPQATYTRYATLPSRNTARWAGDGAPLFLGPVRRSHLQIVGQHPCSNLVNSEHVLL